MRNFEVGYSWMPACHDMYPGFEHIYIRRDMKLVHPTVMERGADRLVRYGNLGLLCSKSKLSDAEEIFSLESTEKEYLTHVMFNVVDACRPGSKNDKYRKSYKDYVVLQDSGGYQLISGVKTFVCPERVAEVHTRYADEGVSLDIPLASVINLDLAKASAKIQVENSKVIRRSFKKDLLAVSHGIDPTIRSVYLERILDSDFSGICLAGLRPIIGRYEPSLPQIALHLNYTIQKSISRTRRFHVLGVSSYTTMLLLSIAAHLYKVRITSDSSRHILCGANGTTLTNPNLSVFKQDGSTTNFSKCSCSICSQIEVDFPFVLTRFMQTHAFNALAKSSAHCNKYGEVFSGLRTAFPTPSKDLLEAVAILESPLSQKDFEKQKLLAKSSFKQGLFQPDLVQDKTELRIKKAIHQYEKFYKRSFL